MDGREGYEHGGFAQVGELVIIPLWAPFNFGVARVLTANADGTLTFQWLANSSDNPRGNLQPGWMRNTAPQLYYSEQIKHPSHKPYTGGDDVVVNQKQLILHGFQLTPGNKLPANVIRALEDDVRVGGG